MENGVLKCGADTHVQTRQLSPKAVNQPNTKLRIKENVFIFYFTQYLRRCDVINGSTLVLDK
jgi:hypothetical protein